MLYDGRTMLGTLKGVDNQTSLVLAEARERIFSPDSGVEEIAVGLYLIKGDQVVLVGAVDEEKDASIDWSRVKGQKPEAMNVGVL